jgi:hypothetical protein
MTTGTFNSGMGSSWAGTFVQAVDMASQADRRDARTANRTSGAEGHRPSRSGWARMAVTGLLIAVSAAGATLVVVIGA